MNEQEFTALSAGYALNALSDDDRRAFDDALAAHPEWAVHVRTDNDTVAHLADTIAPVAPPAHLRAALLSRILDTPQADAVDARVELGSDVEDFAAAGPAPVAAPRAPRRWFMLAASVVLLLAIGFGVTIVSQQLATPAAVVALDRIEGASDAQSATVTLADGGQATAHWSGDLGEAVLVSDGLPTLASDQTFELWYVRDGAAISAGTFSDGASTSLLAGEFHSGDTIAVTVERAGGSPTGTPTSEPIVAIATA